MKRKALEAIEGNVSFGAPGGTRTHNPQIRSLILYPVELRAHTRPPKGSLANIVHLRAVSNYSFGASSRNRTDDK